MIDVESNPIETSKMSAAKSLVETISMKKSGYKEIDLDARREIVLCDILERGLNDGVTKALFWRGKLSRSPSEPSKTN